MQALTLQLPTATASSSTVEEAQGNELVNSGREIRCLKLPGMNIPHCGHSVASPHGKTPMTAVEIPGLKGLRQHLSLGWVYNAGLGQCTGSSAGTDQELSSAAGMGGKQAELKGSNPLQNTPVLALSYFCACSFSLGRDSLQLFECTSAESSRRAKSSLVTSVPLPSRACLWLVHPQCCSVLFLKLN